MFYNGDRHWLQVPSFILSRSGNRQTHTPQSLLGNRAEHQAVLKCHSQQSPLLLYHYSSTVEPYRNNLSWRTSPASIQGDRVWLTPAGSTLMAAGCVQYVSTYEP
jgi:hypothetical protein